MSKPKVNHMFQTVSSRVKGNKTWRSIIHKAQKKALRFAPCAFSSLLALPIYANSLSETLFSLYQHTQQDTTIAQHEQRDNGLYQRLYKQNLQSDIIQQQHTAQAVLTNIITTFPSCQQLTTHDIHAILRHSNNSYRKQLPTLLESYAGNTNFQTNTNNNENTQGNPANSCTKLLSCLQNNEPITLTKSNFATCQQYINTTYKQSRAYAAQLTLLEQQQKNTTQRYQNGTLKDSSYDVLVDMQAINEIIFTSPKPTPVIYNYHFPGTNPDNGTFNNNSPQSPYTTPFTHQDTTNPNQTPANITTNQQVPTQSTLLTNTTYTNPNPIAQTTPAADNQATTAGKPQDIHSPSNANNSTNKNTPNNTSNLFSTNHCIDPITSPATAPNDRASYQTQHNALVDSYNDQQTLLRNILEEANPQNLSPNTISNDQNTNNSSRDAITGHPIDTSNSGLATTPQQTILSCIDTCHQEHQAAQERCEKGNILTQGSCDYQATSQHLICQGQCACNVVPDPQETPAWVQALLDYQIRFCMIPATQTTIANSTHAMSIEDIVDHLNAIFIRLKNSGQLGKRDHSNEFFSPSQPSTKLADIFTFNFSLTFKPIFDSIPDRVRKKTEKQYEHMMRHNQQRFARAQKRLLINNSSNNLLTSTTEQNNLRAYELDNIPTPAESIRILKHYHLAGLDKHTNDFLANSVAMRTAVSELLTQMQTTSASLTALIQQ